jgi:hypothetical protein
VLAGAARRLRRRGARAGVGHRGSGAVLCGGLPHHGGRALARRRTRGRPLDGEPSRPFRGARGRLRAADRSRRLGGRAGRTGPRGRRRAGPSPGRPRPRHDHSENFGHRYRGALARPDRDAVGHRGHRVPDVESGRRLPRLAGPGTGRTRGRLAPGPGRERPRGDPVVAGPGVRGTVPRSEAPLPELRARHRRHRFLPGPPGPGHRGGEVPRRQPGRDRVPRTTTNPTARSCSRWAGATVRPGSAGSSASWN